MSKQRFLGGLLGANPLRQNSVAPNYDHSWIDWSSPDAGTSNYTSLSPNPGWIVSSGADQYQRLEWDLSGKTGWVYLEVAFDDFLGHLELAESYGPAGIVGLPLGLANTNDASMRTNSATNLQIYPAGVTAVTASGVLSAGATDNILGMVANLDDGRYWFFGAEPDGVPNWWGSGTSPTNSTTFDIDTPTGTMSGGIGALVLCSYYGNTSGRGSQSMYINTGGNGALSGYSPSAGAGGNYSSDYWFEPPALPSTAGPFTDAASTPVGTVDRATPNVGILSLDEAGPEVNSVSLSTSTDIGANYILSSEDLDNATYWTPTSNISAVEDATVNGILMHEISPSASQSYGRVYQTVTGLSLATATTATLSVYVKEGTSSDNHCLRVDTAGNSGGFNFVFKFVNGVPTKDAGQTVDFSNYALGTETIEDVGNGLWRITVPFTNNSGSTQSTHVVHCYTTWETANTDSVYFGGVQLVEGSVAGDYAKTTTTTVNTTVTTITGSETRELTQLNWGGIRGRDVVTGDQGTPEIPQGSTSFGGGSNYIEVGAQAQSMDLSGAFTIEAWVRMSSTSGTQRFFDLRTDTVDLTQTLMIDYYKGFRCFVAGVLNQSSQPVATVGTWYHIAAVRDGFDNFAFFVDGSRVASTSSSLDYTLDYDFVIGAAGNQFYPNGTTTSVLNGYMSETRISSTARYDPTAASISVPTAQFEDDTNTLMLLRLNEATLSDVANSSRTITAGGVSNSTSVYKFSTAPAVAATTSLANTGILSLSEMLQVSYGLGAAAPAPVEVTYRGTVSDTNSGTTFTFSTPAAVPSNCLLVVCCSHEQAHNITGLSGGGYTWTEVASTGAFGAADPGGDEAAIFAAEITTPPSSVTLTCGGGVASGFRANATFYSIINHTSATPVATDSSSGSDTSRSVTLSNLSGGDAVIAYAMHQDGGDISFSGTTLDHSSNVSNSTTFASGSEYNGDGTTSQSIQATFNGNSGAMLLVAAAWR